MLPLNGRKFSFFLLSSLPFSVTSIHSVLGGYAWWGYSPLSRREKKGRKGNLRPFKIAVSRGAAHAFFWAIAHPGDRFPCSPLSTRWQFQEQTEKQSPHEVQVASPPHSSAEIILSSCLRNVSTLGSVLSWPTPGNTRAGGQMSRGGNQVAPSPAWLIPKSCVTRREGGGRVVWAGTEELVQLQHDSGAEELRRRFRTAQRRGSFAKCHCLHATTACGQPSRPASPASQPAQGGQPLSTEFVSRGSPSCRFSLRWREGR